MRTTAKSRGGAADGPAAESGADSAAGPNRSSPVSWTRQVVVWMGVAATVAGWRSVAVTEFRVVPSIYLDVQFRKMKVPSGAKCPISRGGWARLARGFDKTVILP